MMTDDMALVREFAASQSEQAFETLVSRHVPLVYSAALRQVGDPHLADEITQAVFIILARKAKSLAEKTILSGWLYRTAQYAAADALKIQRRRQRREQEAYMQSILHDPQTEMELAWHELSPILDKAMAKLRPSDRDAIVLRYFENKSLGEVGDAMGLQERAAQKRISRALEKLRAYFTKHGVASSSATIAGAISANSIQAAPLTLAKSVSAIAITKGAAASGSTLLVNGALKLMAWNNIKTSIIAGAMFVFMTGTGFLAANYFLVSSRPHIQGAWEGDTHVTFLLPFELHSVLNFTKTNRAYKATVYLIELGQRHFPVSRFSYKKGKVRLLLSTLCTFEGEVNSNATEIVGRIKGQAGAAPLILKRTANPPVVPPPLAKEDYARKGYSPQGHWVSSESIIGVPLRVDLKIAEQSNGVLRAEVDTPDNGLEHIPISSIKYENGVINLNVLGANFQGRLSNSGNEIKGSVGAGFVQIPWIFRRAEPETPRSFAFTHKTDLPGHWTAMLNSSVGRLHLILNVARLPDGKFSATLDSPDQGLTGIQATTIQRAPPFYVGIRWIWMGYVFQGKLSDDKITGTWEGDGATNPVVFQRVKPAP